MQIAFAVDGQTPAGVLCQSMEHVVQEANAGVYVDSPRSRLGGMVRRRLQQPRVCVWGKCAAIKVDSDLDLGFVGVASKGGPPGRRLRGAHCVVSMESWRLYHNNLLLELAVRVTARSFVS